MLDDVGPALPETYGGDISTPTLSRIANSGISLQCIAAIIGGL